MSGKNAQPGPQSDVVCRRVADINRHGIVAVLPTHLAQALCGQGKGLVPGCSSSARFIPDAGFPNPPRVRMQGSQRDPLGTQMAFGEPIMLIATDTDDGLTQHGHTQTAVRFTNGANAELIAFRDRILYRLCHELRVSHSTSVRPASKVRQPIPAKGSKPATCLTYSSSKTNRPSPTR